MVIISRKRTLRTDLTRSNKYRQIMARAKKKKPKPQAIISGCNGIAINLRERFDGPNPYSFACSQRCRHPILSVKSLSAASTRHDDWIPEDLYKRYTETDSRPASPDQQNITTTTATIKRCASAPRARSIEPRKCTTPEPETKQCQFHQRRVLILDLRRVKSVDAITRQNSLTTGTSFDSTYADDDGDNRSSKEGSIFQQLSPRNLSVSRSTNRSALGKRIKKSKERSSSPVTYERSSSPKILEGLTLPPLHSSVLTLLGQRPQAVMKQSPRVLSQANQDPLPTGPLTSGRKKLRRQGRKSQGKGQKGKSEKTEDSDKEKSASPPRSSPTKDPFDDPHETQMSAMSNPVEDQEGLSVKDETESNGVVMQTAADLNARRLQAYIEESARSLHQVLDEQLVGTEWNSEEMKHVDENIQALKSSFQKYETKFKTGNMRMSETMWLSLPRTWSRTSATFGVPTDIRMLTRLTPLEYIQKYVFISEPRKLLYSLVFNRYRGMENPTGKTIRYKTVERALAEVLGRSLSPDESEKLQREYLGIEDGKMEISETLFRPICAVAERILGKYSLEDCNDCYKCLKYKDKDKSRCHQNQKDQIEKADLDFVASKIRNGCVNPSLSSLLQTVFMRG